MYFIPVAQKVTFCTNLKNISKTNIILTFLSLIKIHLENSQNKNVARLQRNGRAAGNLSLVCSDFNEKKSPLHLHLFINSEVYGILFGAPQFFSFEQQVLIALAPLTKSTKHIVRLRCRCSCEIGSTSAVPLLVIHETSVKSS